jgi:hypothetical protein
LAQPAPTKVTLTLGSDGYHYLLHYITEGAGLYKAEGLTVEIVRFISGAKIIASVLGGQRRRVDGQRRQLDAGDREGWRHRDLDDALYHHAFAVVLSNDALKKTGITPAMQLARTLFVARGMNPDLSRSST